MANTAALANSINDYITGIGAELGIIPKNTAGFFPPNYSYINSSFKPDAWNKLPFPYSFSVIDILNPGSLDGTDYAEFGLPLAPNKLSQTEQFAISIKATQGGSVTTHSGNKFKKLTIEGTTGISPFRGLAGVKKSNGQVFAKPDKLKFKSGHEVFITLRDYFRTYYEQKATDKSSNVKNWRLIFKNFKDGEFLIVELLDFTMDRSAERSFLYDYKMEFKVLGQVSYEPVEPGFFESLDANINSIVEKIDVARGIFLSSQELLRTVESSYNSTVLEPLRKISLAAKALAGIAITASDVGDRIIKNTITATESLNILKTMQDQITASKTGASSSVPESIKNADIPNDIRNATSNSGSKTISDLGPALLDLPSTILPEATQNALVGELDSASNLPKSFYIDTINDFERIKSNAEDQFNLGDTDYDSLFDRTATNVADSTKIITAEEYDLLGAFSEVIASIEALIVSPALFKSDFKDQTNFIQESFDEDLGLQALPTVKQIIMPADTDLEQIALEQLRDASRWPEIAELNDLKSPFVVQNLTDSRTNTVKPGEVLLIPHQTVFGLSEVPSIKDIPATAGFNVIEKSLGVDLRLTSDMDLALGNNGDLEVIAGAENMGQAVILKIGYEKGELKNHPGLGVGVLVGEKFMSLETIRDNLVGTLTSDQRIERIENVALLREGSALYMSFDIKIKQIDVPIPLKIRL